MNAVILEKIGSNPEFKSVSKNEIPDKLVKVDLHFSALNHRDIWICKGMYPQINLPVILGSDGAGYFGEKKVLINPGFNWGDNPHFQSLDFNVLGMPMDGTLATEVYVHEDYIYEIPSHLSLQEAASLPLAGVTAFRALFKRAQLRKEDKVLINGVGGGVAQFAFQFAVQNGNEVYVTSGSNEKLERAKGMGAKFGANYKSETYIKDLQKESGGFDVIIDSAGGSGFANLIKICQPGARICFYGASLGKITNINPQIVFWRQISILGSTMGSDDDFEEMLAYVSKHKMKPIIDEVFELEDFQMALDKMEKGKQFGKIVLKNR